jgi:hypothetical protein
MRNQRTSVLSSETRRGLPIGASDRKVGHADDLRAWVALRLAKGIELFEVDIAYTPPFIPKRCAVSKPLLGNDWHKLSFSSHGTAAA